MLSLQNKPHDRRAKDGDFEMSVGMSPTMVGMERLDRGRPRKYGKNKLSLLYRPREHGFSLYLDDDGKLVREAPGRGRGMGHGTQYDWMMTVRDTKHPITQGMPVRWMHNHDELYHGQRGPAENVHILLTAYSDPASGRGGTGKNEPIVWWIPFGKGKVVTNVMGHVGELRSMECVGFQVLLNRSCEWAAIGKCITPVLKNFPTAQTTSIEP